MRSKLSLLNIIYDITDKLCRQEIVFLRESLDIWWDISHVIGNKLGWKKKIPLAHQ